MFTASSGAALRARLPPVPRDLFTRCCGSAVLLLLLALWSATWWLGLQAGPGAAQVAAGLVLGTLAGVLVIVGHDAEHGVLSPWRRWNAVASRLAFLPAWQPASGWTHAHRKHHAFTNLKPHDDGYPPPSPQEWRAMSRLQRTRARLALTLPGLWLLYASVWWRAVIWVRSPSRDERWCLRADSLLVLAFVAAQALLAWQLTPASGGAAAVLTLIGLPFLLMNQLVSAITLVHHRHPRVRWFDDPAEWTRLHGQLACTVHVVLPPLLQGALLQIFEHGAHHVDLQRPFCALPAAQRELENLCGDTITVVHDAAPWRLSHLRRVMRECQLYDYRSHRWHRFDEVAVLTRRQTTAPTNSSSTP